MAAHTARQVAEWFLVWGEQNEGTLSNLKVQKLLYYAQGHYLGEHGVSLFDDPVQAWAHGPVVKSVYHDLKRFGSDAVDVDLVVSDSFDWDDYRDVEDCLMRASGTPMDSSKRGRCATRLIVKPRGSPLSLRLGRTR